MKQFIKLGVLCLARKTFDHRAALDIYQKRKEELKAIADVEWVICDPLVIEVEDAEVAANQLASSQVDGVIIISGTFHLGHLALTIDKIVAKPILLWAFNELPYDGGKIRLNAVCGLNLNASNLYKSGNDTYHTIIGDSVDHDWIDAIRIKAAVEHARLGLLGHHAHGFFNLGIDELRLFKDLGILIDQYPLAAIWDRKVSNTTINQCLEDIKKQFDVSTLSKDTLEKVARLTGSMKDFVDEHKLTGLAIRCWPEFAERYGISPCAAMSVLQSQGYILGCEGDVEGTLTMIAAKAIGAQTPFLADLSQVNIEENYALMWHCGVAPCNLWDGSCNRSLDTYFAGGKGVTADFVLKAGPINCFRMDSARGKTRVYMAAGEAIHMEKLLRGTYAKVRFEKHIQQALNQVIDTGVAHHVVMVYGEFRIPFDIFSKIMGFETIK